MLFYYCPRLQFNPSSMNSVSYTVIVLQQPHKYAVLRAVQNANAKVKIFLISQTLASEMHSHDLQIATI